MFLIRFFFTKYVSPNQVLVPYHIPFIYSHFEEKKLSHQLQSGSNFNYKVAQKNYKVAQKNYKVAQKLQSGAEITKRRLTNGKHKFSCGLITTFVTG